MALSDGSTESLHCPHLRFSKSRPLADEMYEVLLNQFMEGRRGAGEALNIGALSRELGVSQTPLREALARLEHTGLVTREALKGYRVASHLSEKDVMKLMEARLVLEGALTREAAMRTTPEFLEALYQTVLDLDRSVELADSEPDAFRLYWASDGRFHALIAAQSGNPFLETAYNALGGQIQRFRLFSKLGNSGASYAAEEHRAIYDALASHDPDAAASRMGAHISGAKTRRHQSNSHE
ncbi:GntR family transcriptional regulator [Paenarthrobacter ureafaciens]|uniref:GntR family transcriptional regulator n=1 Tax=Paenarthrobacter ureafaciens TaxID=37931 RepID=UPI0020C22480|nr:GntR family transcriptional regulator [Paenarthrobacter ureafaciens]